MVSAIGLDKAATAASLLEGRSGIGHLKHLQTVHSELPCGEVDLSDGEMKARLGIPAGTIVPRTSLLGIIAAKEALEQAGLCNPGATRRNLFFINGTTVGGMDITERTYPIIDTKLHDCGGCTRLIADYFGIFGQVTTISTACSSAANAIIFGSELIKAGLAEVVLAGGSECLTRYHLNGFNSLMILDSERCRPFDASRAGLNLGEGAGFVVLESEEHAKARGAEILGLVSGYGNACDAFHQTATSPEGEGAFRAMSEALAMAGLKPSDIDYVNAHGTGTPNNDATESAALRRLFGNAMPPVSSTKSFTGHTTSASGGIETVICLEALRLGFLPGNIGWQNPDADCVRPLPEAVAGSQRNILCNSFGFGGNDSALVISAPLNGEGRIINLRPSPENLPQNAVEGIVDGEGPGTEVRPSPKVVVRSAVYLQGADFEWKHLLNPMQARRLGTLMKRTLVSSLEALKSAAETDRIQIDPSSEQTVSQALPIPDAVITATGLGCMENSEKFLAAMLESGETMMSPTDFMQSTHNTPGSLISIHLKDHGYNSTYSQGADSMASALLDAWLQLKSGKIRTALVGCHDELTPNTAGYTVPDGSLAMVLETVPCTKSPKNENGRQENGLPCINTAEFVNGLCEISGIDGIGELDARNLYNAIRRLASDRPKTGQSDRLSERCGPVILESL